ncbi:hypothetical protein BDA96_04G007300 [Sorghum bicolor]|uniref:Uncharacterized protein n=1 Tax=Sorghum bicolor TaxID=4558 RepID=A0A921UH18_SORBI|nr:hypothetical protein BDA96_04G007300 [Sorghum bicolor]
MHHPRRKKVAHTSHHLARRHPLRGNAQQRKRQGRRHCPHVHRPAARWSSSSSRSSPFPSPISRRRRAGAGWSSPVRDMMDTDSTRILKHFFHHQFQIGSEIIYCAPFITRRTVVVRY